MIIFSSYQTAQKMVRFFLTCGFRRGGRGDNDRFASLKAQVCFINPCSAIKCVGGMAWHGMHWISLAYDGSACRHYCTVR
jgi:hypothetical protein